MSSHAAHDGAERTNFSVMLARLAAVLRDPPPWLSPFLPVAQRITQVNAESLPAALNESSCGLAPVQFVHHSMLPDGEAYESFIARTACVPTRDNAHDLFNAMVWLTYPRTKQRMNALHAQQIALHGTSGSRGPVRDALTLFDENGALLQAPAELSNALRRRDWRELFVAQRALWQSAHLVLFGHALLEKLLHPRKPITAHVWLVEELTDAAVAASLLPERLAAKPFLPLPVSGVPGWCDANQNPVFYDDAEVFRPARSLSV
jgi:hypothetical protein